ADTLERLQARGYAASRIFFVTGADAFADIATRKRYPEVLDLAHFVVVSRPGHQMDALPERLPDLKDRMRPAGAPARTDGGTLIFLLHAPTPELAARVPRERAPRG